MKINTLNPIRITKIGGLLSQIIHNQIIEIITSDQEDKVTTAITVKIHEQAPMKIKRMICLFVCWEWIIFTIRRTIFTMEITQPCNMMMQKTTIGMTNPNPNPNSYDDKYNPYTNNQMSTFDESYPYETNINYYDNASARNYTGLQWFSSLKSE